MLNIEFVIIALIFLFSLLLIFINFRVSLYILLILSVLLHKELFSIYKWDLLPVRIFMLGYLTYGILTCLKWFLINKKPLLSDIKTFFMDPFNLFLILIWFADGVSLFFSENLNASFLLFGFFTTILVLGLLFNKKLAGKSKDVLVYIKSYAFIVFGICLFGFFQFYLYEKHQIIIGALWNIPGKLPRIGTTFWDVNHFGALLASILPILGVFILTAKNIKKKLIYLFLFIPMSVILLLTNSRTAWITFFIAGLLFITLLAVRKFGFKGVYIMLISLILLSLPMIREYSIKSSPFRAKIKDYFHYRLDSFDSHFLLLDGTFEIFSKYPFFGGGYGSFFEQFKKTKISAEYFSRDPAALNTRVPAHTIWGELVAETGIFGLSVYLIFISINLLDLLYISLNFKETEPALFSAAMFSTICGLLIAGVFYSYNAEFFWIILFFYFIYGKNLISENTSLKTTDIIEYFAKISKTPVLVLLFISSFLVFINLGKNHLIPWDEAIYAKVAKNMVLSRDYVVQTWIKERVWYEKPPFYMWLTTVSMKYLGFSSLAARIPSAVFGLLSVIMTFFLGEKLFTKTSGFLSAFVLLTTFQFLYYSRAAMLDVTATFFIMLCFYLYMLSKDKKPVLYCALAGISCGFAVLTKGVVGLIPFAVITLYEIHLYLSKIQKLSRNRIIGYTVFTAASFAVFLPWHLAMYVEFGPAFIKNYIVYHVLDRATTAIEDKGRPIWWYLIVMKVSMRIWFIALIPAFFAAVFLAFKKSKNHIFLLIWSLVIFVMFSVAKSKLIWYIIPLYPAVALLTGNFLDRVLTFFISKIRGINSYIFKIFIIYVLTTFGLLYLFVKKELVYTSDLTGSQALLLEEKDRMFGLDTKIYTDRIDLPLLLYYTNGPYEQVDFGPLKHRLTHAKYDEGVIFITKESRFRSFSTLIPALQLIDQKNEWVLGNMQSVYELDRKELKDTDDDLSAVTAQMNAYITQNKAVPYEISNQYSLLTEKHNELTQRISLGLTTAKN